MARGRTARQPQEDQAEEVKTKDFAQAVRLYRGDILPAQSSIGEFAQEQSTAFKSIKKDCHIQPSAAKAAFKLDGMEEAKRDDWIRCFVGLCGELNIPLQSNDLVDQMEGKNERPRPQLVTVGEPYEGDNTDLAGGFDEASDEELALQAGRGGDEGDD